MKHLKVKSESKETKFVGVPKMTQAQREHARLSSSLESSIARGMKDKSLKSKIK